MFTRKAKAAKNNVDESLEHHFHVDEHADEWEAAKLENVNPDDVHQAKLSELRQLQAQDTVCLVDRKELLPNSKVVGTKWVITNKGTAEAPRLKARLVAQEFATGKSLDFFQGRPRSVP